MKSILIKNVKIQFDSFDEGADVHTARNMLDSINDIIHQRFPDQSPQIFVSDIQNEEIEISPEDEE